MMMNDEMMIIQVGCTWSRAICKSSWGCWV